MKAFFAPAHFALILLAFVTCLSACDSSEAADSGRSVLAEELSRAVVEVAAFGGVAFERPVGAQSGIIVYTLGDNPDAEADLRSRFAGLFFDPDTLYIRARPALGSGSEALAAQVEGIVSRPLRAEYDTRTGYVRVGFWTETAAAQAFYQLQTAGVPLDNVIVQVEDRPSSN